MLRRKIKSHCSTKENQQSYNYVYHQLINLWLGLLIYFCSKKYCERVMDTFLFRMKMNVIESMKISYLICNLFKRKTTKICLKKNINYTYPQKYK